MVKKCNAANICPSSIRANLNRGKYTKVIEIKDCTKTEGREICLEYIKNGGYEFLFRLAASKQCVVDKNNFRVELTLFIKTIYQDVFKLLSILYNLI